MSIWLVAPTWVLAVISAVMAAQSAICRRIWEGRRPPMPYRVFAAFARRRGRWRAQGPSEEERTRYGSHLLRLDDPAVVRAERWLRLTWLLGLLACGLAWPLAGAVRALGPVP